MVRTRPATFSAGCPDAAQPHARRLPAQRQGDGINRECVIAQADRGVEVVVEDDHTRVPSCRATSMHPCSCSKSTDSLPAPAYMAPMPVRTWSRTRTRKSSRLPSPPRARASGCWRRPHLLQKREIVLVVSTAPSSRHAIRTHWWHAPDRSRHRTSTASHTPGAVATTLVANPRGSAVHRPARLGYRVMGVLRPRIADVVEMDAVDGVVAGDVGATARTRTNCRIARVVKT